MNMKNENEAESKTSHKIQDESTIGYGAINTSQIENILRLLLHHPYFRKEITKMRAERDLEGPFSSRKEFHNWYYREEESGDRKKRQLELQNDIHNLLNSFNYMAALRRWAPQFTRICFIFFSGDIFDSKFNRFIDSYKTHFDEKRGVSSSRLMLPTSNTQTHPFRFDSGKIYIEVTPWTTKKEVGEAYNMAQERLPDTTKLQSPKLQEYIWRKSEFEEIKHKKIAKELAQKEKYPSIKNESDYPRVSKEKGKYKKKLNKLREIE